MMERSGEEEEREEKVTTSGTKVDDCKAEHQSARSTHSLQDCGGT